MSSIDDRLDEAVQSHREGDWGTAERQYRAIIQEQPNAAAAYHGLGLLASQIGQSDEALALVGHAIELVPNSPIFRQSIAGLLASHGRHSEAIAHFAEALRLQPDFVQAWNDAGNSLRAVGNVVDAERAYRRAVELAPEMVEAYCNLGLLLHETGALHEARTILQRGIELGPEIAELHFNLGRVLDEAWEPSKAEAAYRRAIKWRPNFAQAWNNLGNVLGKQPGRYDEARAAYLQAVDANIEYVEAQFNLARLEMDHGQVDAAHGRLDSILSREPNHAESAAMLLQIEQDRCDWSRIESLSEVIVKSVEGETVPRIQSSISPLRLIASPYPATSEQLYRLARRTLSRVDAIQAPYFGSHRLPQPNERRLRIGYLSSDFRRHPLGYLIPELIESHNRDRFEIFAYSTIAVPDDPIRNRLMTAFDRFRDVGPMSDDAIARMMADDRIDIVVDLGGHTSGSRFELLSRRPAPVQVTYLGYPGTTGADYIDYILVDEFIVPSVMQRYFSEKLVQLPGSYLVYDSQREVDNRSLSRMDVGLPEDTFVFCAFSQAYKITQPMFDVWLNILRQVPKSVLWLRVDNATARENLIRYTKHHEIDPERLIFAPMIPAAEHPARYQMADLALDSFPYNQHSMSADTLHMGLPMVTMVGETMASRVAGSLLHQLGLGDLATKSFDEYERLVVRLGNDSKLLGDYRRQLNEALQTTNLFSGKAFARNLEQAYIAMCYDKSFRSSP